VIGMRVTLATTVLALAVIASPSLTLAKSASHAPSAARIRSAVRGAERSSSLWATINICDSRRHPNELGVRGQMPALGFSASLSMVVQVDSYSATTKRFVPIPSPQATAKLPIGTVSSLVEQDGQVFPFKPHSGLLNATITFTWTRAGKVLGQTKRRTTAGHKSADFGSPPHFSAAQCKIK
jgi:hypothetical protein